MDFFGHVCCTCADSIAANNVHLKTGMKGRPLVKIPLEMLEYYVDCGFSQKDITALLGIRKRLNRHLSETGISMSSKSSNITDEELHQKYNILFATFLILICAFESQQ